MTNTPGNVLAGKLASGGIHVADLGIEAPVDASTPLPIGWVSLGYTSDNGIVIAPEVESGEWLDHNGNVIRKYVKSFKEILTVTLSETSLPSLSAIYGADNVTQTSNLIHVRHNSSLPPMRAWDLDFLDGADAQRYYIERGQVITKPELTFDSENPVAYEIEIETFIGSDGNFAHRWVEFGGGIAV
ncbi:hypothetical protein [Cryobacterium sp. PH31-O1]|uniref:phage tail tube protein n=1 Tax=Cryobacterium sp. PH31-O1 TaxID=3046306 RepID=UPI0024B9474C|nr:hypothetical protein [Cryobacterium sp. PH31-O1]MDJ0338265.1 hypothetical protein [Cryobacterium sp. PH31-O1]